MTRSRWMQNTAAIALRGWTRCRPENYYIDNDPDKPPIVNWRAHGSLLFINWLNYFVLSVHAV